MKCKRCDKPLINVAWFFGVPPNINDSYCIQCAMYLSFYEQIRSTGRPYSIKLKQGGLNNE